MSTLHPSSTLSVYHDTKLKWVPISSWPEVKGEGDNSARCPCRYRKHLGQLAGLREEVASPRGWDGGKLFSVQSLSHIWLFVTPWTAACQASLFITISWSLLKLISIELVMPSNHLILCRPFLLLSSVFPSIRVLSCESALRIRQPKYWSFSSSYSNEYSGLISFRIDWFDLLAVQGTLNSSLTPQFKSINSSALSLLYGPTVTSIHDYWKNRSFDYTDFCW